jgi:hypothetical protein
MIYIIRILLKNFMLKYRDRSVNGLPISVAPVVEEV